MSSGEHIVEDHPNYVYVLHRGDDAVALPSRASSSRSCTREPAASDSPAPMPVASAARWWGCLRGSGTSVSLGPLDETDPKEPTVEIPNYMTRHTNCTESSGFYSICSFGDC